MKYRYLLISLAALAASCSVEEVKSPELEGTNAPVFYATIDEQPDADTKVYADENLKVLWNEDDRITIFSKNTYNQQYRFLGEDGDNAGGFKIVPSEDEYITSNPLDRVYAVYPYRESTKISNTGIITTAIPSDQTYKENSFGIGSNTMTAMADGNMLKFKNVGGYLSLKFYGEGVSVSSITLKSNNGELIAGECKVDMSSGLPESSMVASNATDEITLTCETPVELGATAEEAVQFIFVLPPLTLSKGFTVKVTTPDGGVFEKSSVKERVIGRSAITPLGAMEVVPEYSQPNNVIYYTSVDGGIITGGFQYANGYLNNEYKDGIGSITFSEDITSIGECWFHECKKLLTIILPDSVDNLENGSFQNCSNLLSIVIPEGVTGIGDSAFDGCKSLNSVTFPNSLISIGLSAFCVCSDLIAINLPEGLVSIGDGAFAYSGLHSVIIPNTVTSIGDQSFQDCKNLNEVILSNSVSNIGDWAFCGTGISSVSIPNSVTTIGQYAFSDCSNLSSVLISSSEMSIGEGAFDNINLESVEFSGGITNIGKRAFYHYGGNALSTVSVSNGILNVGEYSFEECSSLTSINTNNSIIYTERYAFNKCSELSSIDFNDVHSIGGSSFAGCISLVSISISDKVTSIGVGAFSGCTGLTSIEIPDSVTSIGTGAFYGCTGLSSITIPDSVTSLGNRLLYGCNNLISVKLPDTMSSVGDYFFYNCGNLVSIVFPSSLSSIGTFAFSNCNSLTSLVFRSTNPPLLGHSFVFEDFNCPIYVPAGSVDAYKAAEYWSRYADRIQAIPFPVPEAIDLGLPSGLKWASFNLGATSPEEYGEYYAWGETEPYYSSQDPLTWKSGKDAGYAWGSYTFNPSGDGSIFTKYTGSDYSALQLEDDAAHVMLGGNWRIPTDDDWAELMENCTWAWTTKNGVNGMKVIGTNGNNFFLPAAGYYHGMTLEYAGSYADYWSSSLNVAHSALYIFFYSEHMGRSLSQRFWGQSVRPVSE